MKDILIWYGFFTIMSMLGNIFISFETYDIYKLHYPLDSEGLDILRITKEASYLISSSTVCFIPLYHIVVFAISLKVMISNKYALQFAKDYIEEVKPMYEEWKKGGRY